MSRLGKEPDVLQLAKDLGLKGNPVRAILSYCYDRIDRWIGAHGTVSTVGDLESIIADNLNVSFEHFWSDDELNTLIKKYTSQGDGAFASLKILFEGDTFGTLMRRRRNADSDVDQYVAFIDCRDEKASRRFFTRWHELAHALTLTNSTQLPVKRSTAHPIERLMDEIAGDIGFYKPLFLPIMSRHLERGGYLSFGTIEAIQAEYCIEASFQSTLFACLRSTNHPVVYIEAKPGYKASERRQLSSSQMDMFGKPKPTPKLRVEKAVPNQYAVQSGLRVIKPMRVPEKSIVYQVYSDALHDPISGNENLEIWETSDGYCLGCTNVWVEAKRLQDRAIALIQSQVE